MTRQPKEETPRLLMAVRRNTLVPLTAYDVELLDRYREGQELEATLFAVKSNKLLRKYWSVLTYAAPALGTTPDLLSWQLKVKTGLVKRFETLGGEWTVMPESLATLDAPMFEEYYRAAMYRLSNDWMGGLSDDEIIDRGKGVVR